MDSRTALNELQNFQNTRKSAGDYYNEAQSQLGVGAAQQRANDLRGLIRNTETALKGVDSSVRGRTQGSLVTSAQQSRLAALEREPLAEELGGHQGAYSDEMANYRDLLGQAGTRAGFGYQTDTDKANSLQQRYQALFGQEQADQQARQWQAQFDFNKQQAEAAKKQTEALYNRINASFNKPTTTNTTSTNPMQQKAYNEVQDRVNNQSIQEIESDYRATLLSSLYGNAYDKLKIELYRQALPGQFKTMSQDDAMKLLKSKGAF